jgi:hypothetical protein
MLKYLLSKRYFIFSGFVFRLLRRNKNKLKTDVEILWFFNFNRKIENDKNKKSDIGESTGAGVRLYLTVMLFIAFTEIRVRHSMK